MPPSRTFPSLQTELSKAAKLSNVQAGLPPLIRGLPVLAILAGEVVAKATNGQNAVEERILGFDEAVLLQAPTRQLSLTETHVWARPGIAEMCQMCNKTKSKSPIVTQTDVLRA
ncbi:hypothetical protein AK830_g8541 [Neonectria ditissima]|uniref:Uncharacterized protein n=1 Tax=Neonectria ditissima TaxID=78410 RepID=A0A0P7BC92_9HYPO|nr:hypothetical protein AK830_g8541 [Neonectria ditissima]